MLTDKEKEEFIKINDPLIASFKQWLKDNPHVNIEIEERHKETMQVEMSHLTIRKKRSVLCYVNTEGADLQPVLEKIMQIYGERNANA